jgi:hypothetical protein
MIKLAAAPITYTRDMAIKSTLEYEIKKDFEEIKEKYKESYLFKSGIDYGIVYFVMEDHGVLLIRIEAKSDHVYNDLVLILKEEYPNGKIMKLSPSL